MDKAAKDLDVMFRKFYQVIVCYRLQGKYAFLYYCQDKIKQRIGLSKQKIIKMLLPKIPQVTYIILRTLQQMNLGTYIFCKFRIINELREISKDVVHRPLQEK